MKLSYALFRSRVLAVLCCCSPVAEGAGSESEQPVSEGALPTTEQKPGYFFGDLRVRPSISVTQEYDNNVFTAARDEVSDWILRVSPLVKIDSTEANRRLQMEAGAEMGRYREYTDENYADYHASLDLQSDITEDIVFYAGLGFRADHESRDSPDAQLGALEPTRFRSADANIGLKTQQGDVTYRLGVTYQVLDFDDTPSAGGEIINDDRDRQLAGGGLRAAVRVTDAARLFAQAFYDNRNYDLPRDQAGFRRDSAGYRAAMGVALEPTSGGELEAYVGLIRQRYADSRFDDVREIDFGARLAIAPTPWSKATVELQRSLNETTDPGASGYLNTSLSGNLEYRISPRLIPYVGLDYDSDDYFGTGRNEDTFSASAGAKYFLTRNTSLTGGLHYSSRDSDGSGSTAGAEAFDRVVVFLNFTALLYPLPE